MTYYNFGKYFCISGKLFFISCSHQEVSLCPQTSVFEYTSSICTSPIFSFTKIIILFQDVLGDSFDHAILNSHFAIYQISQQCIFSALVVWIKPSIRANISLIVAYVISQADLYFFSNNFMKCLSAYSLTKTLYRLKDIRRFFLSYQIIWNYFLFFTNHPRNLLVSKINNFWSRCSLPFFSYLI